jgi:hypothetical protein
MAGCDCSQHSASPHLSELAKKGRQWQSGSLKCHCILQIILRAVVCWNGSWCFTVDSKCLGWTGIIKWKKSVQRGGGGCCVNALALECYWAGKTKRTRGGGGHAAQINVAYVSLQNCGWGTWRQEIIGRSRIRWDYNFEIPTENWAYDVGTGFVWLRTGATDWHHVQYSTNDDGLSGCKNNGKYRDQFSNC